MAQVHVRLSGVTRVYPGRDGGVHALGPLDLDLNKGEFFAVVGPSGCGKSTLLEMIAGLAPPTEGQVEFEGRPIGAGTPDGIGVVFQENACFPWLTVADNITFGLKRLPVALGEVERRLQYALQLMGLQAFARAYPAQLSGGMRQRVCIARTLVAQPRLILLDEPFGALDQQTRLLMGDELLRLWRATGATVLLITHALDEAAMLADRVAVMSARPGCILDVIETGFSPDRDSRIVSDPAFGAVTGRLWSLLREQSLSALGLDALNRVRFYRALAVAIPVALLELACRLSWINRQTLPPPSDMALGLYAILRSGRMTGAIIETFRNVLVAFGGAVVVGVAAGAVVQRLAPLRRVLEPLLSTYYAVPIYGFYPLFLVMFGLGDRPEILIGFMLAVVAVITATLSGLDSVPQVLVKTARVFRLNPVRTAWSVTLPYAAPHLFTGIKLAAAYSFIGVIGAEFIMSQSGLGYEIRYAFDNLDNAVMYPLILLVLLVAVAVNTTLDAWDRTLRARRGEGR